jgi:agmatine deiminase
MTTNNRRFPAEWENQQGILLCFPHNGQTGQENTKRFNGRLLNSSKVATYETVF